VGAIVKAVGVVGVVNGDFVVGKGDVVVGLMAS